MTDAQMQDFKAHGDAYFGKAGRKHHVSNTPYELFEFFLDAYRELSRDEVMRRIGDADRGAEELPDDEVLAIYCEGLVASATSMRDRQSAAGIKDHDG